jgi:hypothetical protein
MTIKVGGYGQDGCTCAMQAGGCPVHNCTECGEVINDGDLRVHGPRGRMHFRCFKQGKARGRLVQPDEADTRLAEYRALLHDIVTGNGQQLETLDMSAEELNAVLDQDIPIEIDPDHMRRALRLLGVDVAAPRRDPARELCRTELLALAGWISDRCDLGVDRSVVAEPAVLVARDIYAEIERRLAELVAASAPAAADLPDDVDVLRQQVLELERLHVARWEVIAHAAKMRELLESVQQFLTSLEWNDAPKERLESNGFIAAIDALLEHVPADAVRRQLGDDDALTRICRAAAAAGDPDIDWMVMIKAAAVEAVRIVKARYELELKGDSPSGPPWVDEILDRLFIELTQPTLGIGRIWSTADLTVIEQMLEDRVVALIHETQDETAVRRALVRIAQRLPAPPATAPEPRP